MDRYMLGWRTTTHVPEMPWSNHGGCRRTREPGPLGELHGRSLNVEDMRLWFEYWPSLLRSHWSATRWLWSTGWQFQSRNVARAAITTSSLSRSRSWSYMAACYLGLQSIGRGSEGPGSGPCQDVQSWLPGCNGGQHYLYRRGWGPRSDNSRIVREGPRQSLAGRPDFRDAVRRARVRRHGVLALWLAAVGRGQRPEGWEHWPRHQLWSGLLMWCSLQGEGRLGAVCYARHPTNGFMVDHNPTSRWCRRRGAGIGTPHLTPGVIQTFEYLLCIAGISTLKSLQISQCLLNSLIAQILVRYLQSKLRAFYKLLGFKSVYYPKNFTLQINSSLMYNILKW